MKNNDTEHDVKSFIDLMDHDELMKLNEYIVKRIRFLREIATIEKLQHFELLERVYFIDNEGNRIEGTIIGINNKTVTIKTDSGTEWRVNPQLLKVDLEH